MKERMSAANNKDFIWYRSQFLLCLFTFYCRFYRAAELFQNHSTTGHVNCTIHLQPRILRIMPKTGDFYRLSDLYCAMSIFINLPLVRLSERSLLSIYIIYFIAIKILIKYYWPIANELTRAVFSIIEPVAWQKGCKRVSSALRNTVLMILKTSNIRLEFLCKFSS